ncbi:MAG: hypothetical protein M3527_05425 [Actinomycetota bacterium]|nr:hypothetical protein [Acidimicrobiia bacterium]MDQ3293875.1 hypothetical protein [Actinomycetota bacterium]
MPPTIEGLAGQVRVSRDGGVVTIALHGRLDAHAGLELLAALQEELEGGADRIDVDLLAVDDWSPEGARALRRCRRLAHGLTDGLHYRTAAGAGHQALLDAYNDDDPDDDE